MKESLSFIYQQVSEGDGQQMLPERWNKAFSTKFIQCLSSKYQKANGTLFSGYVTFSHQCLYQLCYNNILYEFSSTLSVLMPH